MNKNLKYFMREEAKQEQIVEVAAPDTFKDEKGNPVMMQIKKLSNETINKINDMYRSRVPARDKKGNFIINNGELVYKVEKDIQKASRHIMVEAIVYPNLKEPEIMKFYDCVAITDMPYRVFPTSEEYLDVNKKVMQVLGMVEDEDDDKEIEDGKNL